MSDLTVTLRALVTHPVKSCAGIAQERALLVETGLEFDRDWMLVDRHGDFVSQRELPRMQLVRPTVRGSDMVLRAPGMLALHVGLDTVHEPCRVRVWDDALEAYDMGDLAAQWFSDFLGTELRMARFDPEHRRLADGRWTDGIETDVAFSDGFPLLIASQASLDGLNLRLNAVGEPPVTMARFRPNLVLDGLDAHGEDHLRRITFVTAEGPVVLRPVKPCTRCSVPDVDPDTAAVGQGVSRELARYRADPRMQGGITFGMNAIIEAGVGCTLAVGMVGEAEIAF